MMRVLMGRSGRNCEEMAAALAFSTEGDWLAVGVNSASVRDTKWYHPYGRLISTSTTRAARVVLVPMSGDPKAGDERFGRDFGRGSIKSLAVSPDGRRVAASLVGGSIQLWDPATPVETTVLEGHTKTVGTLAFSPDGVSLTSGSKSRDHTSKRPGRLNVWDVATAKLREGLDTEAGVRALAYSPDGSTIAVGTDRLVLRGARTLRIWAEESFRGETPLWDDVYHLAFLSGGRQIACVRRWGLGIWDVRSRAWSPVVKGHKRAIQALAASPDGRTLATGTTDGIVRIWELDPAGDRGGQLRERACYDGGIGGVRSLAFSPDGSIIAAGGDGANYLVLWDLE